MNVMPLNTYFEQIKPIAKHSVVASNLEQLDVSNNISFGAVLAQQLEQVNSSMVHANETARQFELDDQNIDIPSLMISQQRAHLAFSALVETRNKLVRAYQEIMHMQI